VRLAVCCWRPAFPDAPLPPRPPRRSLIFTCGVPLWRACDVLLYIEQRALPLPFCLFHRKQSLRSAHNRTALATKPLSVVGSWPGRQWPHGHSGSQLLGRAVPVIFFLLSMCARLPHVVNVGAPTLGAVPTVGSPPPAAAGTPRRHCGR